MGYEEDLNLYAYVRNDPLNHSDPTGRTCADDASCTKTVQVNTQIATQHPIAYAAVAVTTIAVAVALPAALATIGSGGAATLVGDVALTGAGTTGATATAAGEGAVVTETATAGTTAAGRQAISAVAQRAAQQQQAATRIIQGLRTPTANATARVGVAENVAAQRTAAGAASGEPVPQTLSQKIAEGFRAVFEFFGMGGGA